MVLSAANDFIDGIFNDLSGVPTLREITPDEAELSQRYADQIKNTLDKKGVEAGYIWRSAGKAWLDNPITDAKFGHGAAFIRNEDDSYTIYNFTSPPKAEGQEESNPTYLHFSTFFNCQPRTRIFLKAIKHRGAF